MYIKLRPNDVQKIEEGKPSRPQLISYDVAYREINLCQKNKLR